MAAFRIGSSKRIENIGFDRENNVLYRCGKCQSTDIEIHPYDDGEDAEGNSYCDIQLLCKKCGNESWD